MSMPFGLKMTSDFDTGKSATLFTSSKALNSFNLPKQQLLEKQRENNAAYVEFLEEKRLIDEVIAKVKAEQRTARLEVVARYVNVNGHVLNIK